MSAEYAAYIEKQNGIYDNAFRAAHATVGDTRGLERDIKGAAPQSAYIVAWRHPEVITDQVEEVSLGINGIVKSITYGRANAHTTLSDLAVKPGTDYAETLDALSRAVKDGLDSAGHRAIAHREVKFEDTVTNGTTVVTTGQANHSVWEINEAIKAAADNYGVVLNGSWGSHMTDDRFLEELPVDEAAAVPAYLGKVAHFGISKPTSIDVGYFHTDPINGFQLTTYERFDLGRL